MIRKLLLSAAFGAALTAGMANAQVYVQVGPPRPIVEQRIVSPGPGYVWTPGYHRWDGSRYNWVGGTWVLPPHPHQRWVEGRWRHRRSGWYYTDGRWR